MNFVRIMILLILVQSSAVHAAKIKQLLNDQNLVIVELKKNEKIEVGESFIASDEKNQCLLEVISVDKKIATATSKNCSDKSPLVVGKKIEKSLFDANLVKQVEKVEISAPVSNDSSQAQDKPSGAVEAKKMPTENDSYRAIIVGYTSSPKIVITGEVSTGSSSESGTLEYSFKNDIKLGFEWSQFNKNSWNHGILIDYTSLKFDTATLNSSISGASTPIIIVGGMTLLTVIYSGKYRWEQFYLPIGVGFTSSTVDIQPRINLDLFTKTMRATLFTSLGFGIVVTDKVNFEITSNSSYVDSKSVTFSNSPDPGTTSILPRYGFLTYLQLAAKILF